MSNPPVPFLLEGELVGDVFVTPEDMARMNQARAAFKELKAILLLQVVPALGGFGNPLAGEIERRIELVTFRSQNFLFPHRYVGAAQEAANARGTK